MSAGDDWGRDRKFEWKKGDTKFNFSQCAYCLNNKSATKCKAYGGKPMKYLFDEQVCPKKVLK